MSNLKTSACRPPASITRKHTSPFLNNAGFTMVEMIVVMLIIGVLALLAMPAYRDVKTRTRNARTVTELRGIEKAIIAFAIDNNGAYPASLGDVKLDGVRDPWGNPYQYNPACTRLDGFLPLNTSFDLYSKGPDGVSEDAIDADSSADDIIRANEGGFLGTVRDYLP